MTMPSRVDITNAVKYSEFIKDPFFDGYSIALKEKGNPNPQIWGGGFSVVYRLEKSDEKWAFKVWHTEIPNNKERYQKIVSHLSKYNLPYFLRFKYFCQN